MLAIVNLDNASGAAIQEKAKQQGIATIDYDRLTLGGSAEYYVSFNNEKVGQLQGEGLQNCLGKDTKANIVYLNGSPDDSNATSFSKGAHSVLDANTNYTKVVASRPSPAGTTSRPATIFEQMFTQQQGQDRRGARGQRRPRWRRDRDPGQERGRPARSRSPVRTPPCRVFRTCSPARSA